MFNDEKEDLIDISIYYKKNGRHYEACSKKVFLEKNSEDRSKYQELNVKMKNLTWGIYNELQDFLLDGNYKKYKENKLKTLMVQWDAKKNGENDTIPITSKVIEDLSPEIAEEILSSYDDIMFVDEKEERRIAGQIHARVMGKGRSSSVISRAITENDLIEEFHWLPQDIAKIPYRQLQMFFIVRREKVAARNAKVAVDALKRQQENPSKGQKRKMLR